MDEQSESTIGSSPVIVFLTKNCSVMGTEVPMRQTERQQKAFRFNKTKVFALARLSVLFSVLTLSLGSGRMLL